MSSKKPQIRIWQQARNIWQASSSSLSRSYFWSPSWSSLSGSFCNSLCWAFGYVYIPWNLNIKILLLLWICNMSLFILSCVLCSHFIFKTCTLVFNIFVIKDFTQFDWFIFLAKKILKEKETLSTILANFFRLKISSENWLELYAHAH